MKTFIAIFLCLSFACDALPWPSHDLVKSMDANRIYDVDNGKRSLRLIGKDENGFVNIIGRSYDSNNGHVSTNLVITASIYHQDQPEDFSLVFLDQNKEYVSQIDFTRRSSGAPYRYSAPMKNIDLWKIRWFIFVF